MIRAAVSGTHAREDWRGADNLSRFAMLNHAKSGDPAQLTAGFDMANAVADSYQKTQDQAGDAMEDVALELATAPIPGVPAAGLGKLVGKVAGLVKNAGGRGLKKVYTSIGGPSGRSLTPSNLTKGWKLGNPINNLTSRGTVPKWRAVRERHWKNKALNNPHGYTPKNIKRMKQGKAPQRTSESIGSPESMECHHDPAQRDGGLYDFKEMWPSDHANADPYRLIK